VKAPTEILVVEDNPADIRLLREGLSTTPHIRLRVVENGYEALEYLQSCGTQNASIPSLILMDLNLPGLDGRDLLARIKGDDRLKRIPVIVFSTSESPEDIFACYDRQANCYLQKPLHWHEYRETVRRCMDFWMNTTCLPRADRAL
jgi:CheY-like chemotaxis protein